MNIRPIRSEADYHHTLREVSTLVDLDPSPDSPEGERLDVLATLVEKYESRHHAIAAPDPIEAIKFRMEQIGATPKDLEPYFGRVNRVYEVLSGSRQLSLAMIRKLHSEMHIPAESLIAEQTRARAA
jgi:HTH-type transcriptional regulator/antitoxin HigA